MISLIKRIYKKEPNLYGKYFLSLEADDEPAEEEVTEENKPKRNVKVVQVKPNNRRKHFADVGPEPNSADPVEVDTSSDDAPDMDDTSFDGSDTETTSNEPTDDRDDAPDTGGDNEGNFADEPDNTESQTNTDDTNTGGDGDDSPETGDETNFADMGGEDDGDSDADSSADTAQEESNEKKKPGVEYDSTRKYNLFKEYMSLYNATDNYISKLENILKNDLTQNQIIRICANNLRDIKDILYDFMTIKFQNSTYIQSLIFYQKMVLSVQLIFKLLKISNETKDKKNKTNGSKQ